MNRRVIVVTGAGAGVGRATVRRLAGPGTAIALIGRGRHRLEDARAEVEAAGGRALVIPVDVADAGAVEEAADRTEAELGPIDVWINNAMVTVFSPVADMTADEYRRVTEVTYLGAVHGTLSALRRMKKRGRGRIIQIGSALAYRSIPLQSAYCAAKHALVGFTDSLRTELIHDRSRIRLTTVHLPALNTPQFEWGRTHVDRSPQPVPPIYDADVAARAVAWAVEHHRRELWVGYPTVATILAQRIAPGLLDRYLGVTGYEAQMTSRQVGDDRPDNLFRPAPGDQAAAGPFAGRSRPQSPQLALAMHRRALAWAGLTVLAAGLLNWARRR